MAIGNFSETIYQLKVPPEGTGLLKLPAKGTELPAKGTAAMITQKC